MSRLQGVGEEGEVCLSSLCGREEAGVLHGRKMKPDDETMEDELWRLRTIETDRDHWSRIAERASNTLEKQREQCDRVAAELRVQKERNELLAKTIVAKDGVLEKNQEELSLLRSKVKLEDEYSFKVMEFRVAARHWTIAKQQFSEVASPHYAPGDMIPLLLEYK